MSGSSGRATAWPWLLWALALLAVAYTARNPLYLALALVVLWAVGESLGRPLSLRLLLTLVGLATAWNFVAVHAGATVLFRLPADWFLIGGAYTLEAALFGALNGLALAIILGAFGLLMGQLSPRDVVRLLPPALYEVGLVLSLALAFLPQSRETLEQIRQAQAVRGHRVRGLRDLLPLLLPLLITALERALQLSESLEARGFTARRGRIPASAGRWFLLALGCLLAGSGAYLFAAASLWRGGLLLAGMGALALGLRRLGQAAPRTSFRPRVAAPREWVIGWGAALALLGWGALLVARPGFAAYDPYPQLSPPDFSLLAALPLVFLALPALVGVLPDALAAPVSTFATGLESGPSPVVAPEIVFAGVTFAYPGAGAPVLRDVHLTIPPGAFVLITGPSGSGKSTLLRCINGLVPQATGGTFAGQVRVGALEAARAGAQQLALEVGLVVQSPEAGFVADTVEDEVAFGLELAGLAPAEIALRLEAALALTGVADLRERSLEKLSGGERQRAALAAALASRPPVLLLDEPLSQLDPVAADEILAFLETLHAQGITIIVTEHRLERLLPLATQVVYLNGDGTLWSASAAEAAERLPAPPPVVALGRALGWRPLPLSVEAVRPFAAALPAFPRSVEVRASEPPLLLQANALTVAYNGAPVLAGLDLTLRAGELVVLLGPNGAGKSTLLRGLVGLLPLRTGRLWLEGTDITAWDVAERCRKIGYLPQEPDLLLFAETVTEELAVTLRNQGLLEAPRVAELLEQLGVTRYAQMYPRDLSVGERQRVALGAIAIHRPALLLLDEPTRGLDMPIKQALGELLRGWCAAGMSVLLVTHDVEWAVDFADRVLLMEQGQLAADGKPADVFPAARDFAPQLARLFPGAGVLTVAQALLMIELRKGGNFTPSRQDF